MKIETYREQLSTADPMERAILTARIGADRDLTEAQRHELMLQVRAHAPAVQDRKFGSAEVWAWTEVSVVNSKLKQMQYEMETVLDKLDDSLEEDAITVFCITLEKLRGILTRRAAEKGKM